MFQQVRNKHSPYVISKFNILRHLDKQRTVIAQNQNDMNSIKAIEDCMQTMLDNVEQVMHSNGLSMHIFYN
jgi:hypothetical protein